MAYNRGKILKKIASKEKEIDQGKNLSSDQLSVLRDDLEVLNIEKQAQLEPQLEESNSGIPNDADSLARQFNMFLAEGYNDIYDDNGKAVFEVDIENIEEYLKLIPRKNSDVDLDIRFDISDFHNKCLEYVDSLIINDDYTERQKIKDEILPYITQYYESLTRETITEPDKMREGGVRKSKIVNFNNNSEGIIDQIFKILLDNNIVGYEVEKNIEQLNEPTENQIGVSAMASKKFNLKKHAEKVYDTLRERDIMHTDLQYLTRHPKTIKQYEEVYIGDYLWQHSVMDKYYPETQDPKTGEYVGGYINDRFHVHVNTEGNSMRARPDGTVPDRPESYSTERRLEELRYDKSREYTPSEGEKTEQQNKIVASSNFKFSKEAGLHKVAFDNKVLYIDTDDELEIFKRLAQVNSEEGQLEENEVAKKKTPIIEKEANSENPFINSLGDLTQYKSLEELQEAMADINRQLFTSGYDAERIRYWQSEIINQYNQSNSLPNEIPNKSQFNPATNANPHDAHSGTQEEVNETAEKLGL
jgi:hypothetical protein